MTVSTSRELLHPLAVDADERGGPLVLMRNGVKNNDGSLTQRSSLLQGGVASGPWGLALSYGELHRIDNSGRWLTLARRFASAEEELATVGLFDGVDGQAIALVGASLPSTPRSKLGDDPQAPIGDVMQGKISRAWAKRCLGSRGLRLQQASSFSCFKRAGLAHGALGYRAVIAGPESPTGQDLRGYAASLDLPGWCHGMAGLAVAALIAHSESGSTESLAIAVEAAHASLETETETDGLCHGAAGVLAVASGVCRIARDGDLRKKILDRVDALLRRAQRGLLRLDPSRIVDQTWLTGVAGIAWGLLVVDQRPRVNPLCPPDSLVYQERRVVKPSAAT